MYANTSSVVVFEIIMNDIEPSVRCQGACSFCSLKIYFSCIAKENSVLSVSGLIPKTCIICMDDVVVNLFVLPLM